MLQLVRSWGVVPIALLLVLAGLGLVVLATRKGDEPVGRAEFVPLPDLQTGSVAAGSVSSFVDVASLVGDCPDFTPVGTDDGIESRRPCHGDPCTLADVERPYTYFNSVHYMVLLGQGMEPEKAAKRSFGTMVCTGGPGNKRWGPVVPGGGCPRALLDGATVRVPWPHGPTAECRDGEWS